MEDESDTPPTGYLHGGKAMSGPDIRWRQHFQQLPMPYFFDVVNYHSLQEPRLIEHIDRVGVVLFEREGCDSQGDEKPGAHPTGRME